MIAGDAFMSIVNISMKQAKIASVDKIYACDVYFASNYKTKLAIAHVSRKKRKQQQEREKAAQNGRVRKYTKEMRNRDAITKMSRAMRRAALKTKTTKDDDFADAALNPGRKFDDIVYNAATSDDAADVIDCVFKDISCDE